MAPAKSTNSTLRHASLAFAVLVLIQYGIGMAVNIYVTVPKDDQGSGFGKSFSNAMKGPGALPAHAGIGILLLVAAIWLLLRAVLARHRVVLASSVVALLAVVGAASSGVNFVNTGQNSASLTMALLTGLALLCALVNLYVLGGGGVQAQAQGQAVAVAGSEE